jgi:hypothetical protein
MKEQPNAAVGERRVRLCRAVSRRVLPRFSGTIGFGCRRKALHLVGAARDYVGHAVKDAMTVTRELVDRLTDTGAGLLILFGSPLAQIPCRIGHSLSNF